MSFIDMTKSDVWSEADITNRTEAMVHGEFPVQEENIMMRKVTAVSMGQWALTEAEQAALARYAEVCNLAYLENVAARADMALLTEVLAFEADPAIPLSPAAQVVYALRHPPEPDPAPTPTIEEPAE